MESENNKSNIIQFHEAREKVNALKKSGELKTPNFEKFNTILTGDNIGEDFEYLVEEILYFFHMYFAESDNYKVPLELDIIINLLEGLIIRDCGDQEHPAVSFLRTVMKPIRVSKITIENIEDLSEEEIEAMVKSQLENISFDELQNGESLAIQNMIMEKRGEEVCCILVLSDYSIITACSDECEVPKYRGLEQSDLKSTDAINLAHQRFYEKLIKLKE
jgi:hypothetical protein